MLIRQECESLLYFKACGPLNISKDETKMHVQSCGCRFMWHPCGEYAMYSNGDLPISRYPAQYITKLDTAFIPGPPQPSTTEETIESKPRDDFRERIQSERAAALRNLPIYALEWTDPTTGVLRTVYRYYQSDTSCNSTDYGDESESPEPSPTDQ